jgi:hypothetical protein
MTYRVHYNPKSGNGKTGKIPVTMTERATCPQACPLKANGCYAEAHWVGRHWAKLDNPDNGISWAELCEKIASLPMGQLWRHNVAGDLPHDNELINWTSVYQLTQANRGKRGFTYTHHRVEGTDTIASENRDTIRRMNQSGFTVNLSANNLEHADKLKALDIGPVVTILPEDAEKVTITPAGNQVVICPAVQNENITCAVCGVCAVSTRRTIIGFPVHGTSKKKAHKVFMLAKA